MDLELRKEKMLKLLSFTKFIRKISMAISLFIAAIGAITVMFYLQDGFIDVSFAYFYAVVTILYISLNVYIFSELNNAKKQVVYSEKINYRFICILIIASIPTIIVFMYNLYVLYKVYTFNHEIEVFVETNDIYSYQI